MSIPFAKTGESGCPFAATIFSLEIQGEFRVAFKYPRSLIINTSDNTLVANHCMAEWFR